jgi:threonine dehydrogenase-like Zn-dependent dehydrogenase
LAVAKKTAVALKSPSLSFIEAASLPIRGCTALQALRDLGKLSKGANALILGGAGGVGHFAVQIAKALGAKTRATCGPSNIAFVQSLGADHVIDYSSKDFMADVDHFDVIFDAVGKSSFVNCGPPRARRNLCDDAAYAEPLFLEWRTIDCRNFRNAKRAKGILVQPSGRISLTSPAG